MNIYFIDTLNQYPPPPRSHPVPSLASATTKIIPFLKHLCLFKDFHIFEKNLFIPQNSYKPNTILFTTEVLLSISFPCLGKY